jgi:hypothetical protein
MIRISFVQSDETAALMAAEEYNEFTKEEKE